MNIIEKLGISASPWIVGELTEHPQLEDCYAVFSKKDVPCRSNATSIAITGLMDDNKERLNTTLADSQLIAAAPEMLERDIKFREYLFNEIDKYLRMGDTGNVYMLREIWKNFDFTIDEKATNKSWTEIKELINA